MTKPDRKLASGVTPEDAEAKTGERAARALDYHLNLISWLQTTPATDLYLIIGRLMNDVPEKHQDGGLSRILDFDHHDQAQFTSRMHTPHYHDVVSRGRLQADVSLLMASPTYFVTGDMGRIANLAADSLEPGTALMPMDLPTQKGFAYFSSGLWATDYGNYDDREVQPRVLIRAASWEHRTDIQVIEDDELVERPGVRYTLWTTSDAIDQSSGKDRSEFRDNFKHWPFESSAWCYGRNYDVITEDIDNQFSAGTGQVIPEVDWQRRFLLALWTLMGQEVAVVRPVDLDRSHRRAILRLREKMPEIGDLKIVRLRREYNPLLELADEEVQRPTGEREWTHRWWVRDHWAWRACGPGRTERRRVWIAPYIKGPESKPLIEKDIIYSLER